MPSNKNRHGLHISSTLTLPEETTTETLAILAMRGAGKTYTGSVLAEEMIRAGLPLLIIDPLGVWWGLRSSADGQSDGLPVVIFGGDHADVPLNEGSAELVADAIVENRFPAILDLSHFSKSAMRRFATPFLERLYHRNRDPLHVIVDEADLFCMTADTEILTEAGWAQWHDVRPGTVAVTFDLESGTYGYGAVSRVIVRQHEGEMVSLKTKGLDCLVTPEHRVVLRRERRGPNRHTHDSKVYPWTFVSADKVPGQIQIPCGGAPTGPGIDDLDAETLRMLGWIITDGFHHDKRKSSNLCIQQSITTVKAGVQIAAEMDAVLNPLPGVSRYVRPPRSSVRPDRTVDCAESWAWYLGMQQSERLWKWLGEDLHQIPRRILEEASRDQLLHLFQGLMEGDGTTVDGRWERFFPGQNESLADAFQELCLRLGINTLKTWVPQIRQWHVVLNQRSTHHRVKKVGRENYSGLVWDITVPSGAFVARRNGRVFVTGNCPQKVQADGARLLGAMDDIQRRGRARGLGTTLITQRPAVLNKDVLTQASVLVVLGMTGPRDVSAIDEWVRLHATDDQAREVKASLPSLPVGTAWVWSPSFLGLLEKVKIRRRSTFDSSATPKIGTKRVVPQRITPVDLDRLGAQIAQAAQQAAQSDPKALRARIRDLEHQLARAQSGLDGNARPAPEPEIVEIEVPVPVLDDHDRRALQGLLDQGHETGALIEKTLDAYRTALTDLTAKVATAVGPDALNQKPRPVSRTQPPPSRAAHTPEPAAPETVGSRPVSPVLTEVTSTAREGLAKAERKILSALAQHGERTTQQVALLTGYSHKSGGFRNALSRLRTSGYIDGRGSVRATDAGLDALGDYDPLPTGSALIDWWKDHHLGKAERAIIDVLVDAYPAPVPTEQIAEETGYSASSGGFRNALSRLRSLELASGRGELVLSDTLATD